MTAESIAKALGGRKAGSAWMVRCPAHEDRDPSLSIADGDNGKVLVRCHAGCEQHQVIAALRAEGIWAVFHYVPLHSSPAGMRFGRTVGSLPVTEEMSERQLRLPLWPDMTPNHVQIVVEAISRVLRA